MDIKNALTVAQKGFELPQKLTESENLIVLATKSVRIAELPEQDLRKLATQIVSTSRARLASKELTKDELLAEITMISDDLKGFKGLTSTEIHLALKSGLNGEFSKDGVVYFSSSNFVQWVKRWIAEKKQPVMKNYTALEQAREDVKPPPSLEEYKALIIQIANQYAHEKFRHDDKKRIWLEEIERCKKEIEFEPDIIKKRVYQTQINLVQIDLKKHQPFEVHYAATLYEDLEKFSIWKMPPDDKKKIFEELEKRFKNFSKQEVKKLAQNKAYNVFISMLVAEGKVVNEGGEIVLKSI